LGALDLLGVRLLNVASKTRPTITENIKEILLSIKNLLDFHEHAPGMASAFLAVRSIAATLCPEEEAALADVVPYVLSATKDKELALSSLSSLSLIS